jgi:uncharacterized sporulation protein YeaH/YhbH (DUF444 family)
VIRAERRIAGLAMRQREDEDEEEFEDVFECSFTADEDKEKVQEVDELEDEEVAGKECKTKEIAEQDADADAEGEDDFEFLVSRSPRM